MTPEDQIKELREEISKLRERLAVLEARPVLHSTPTYHTAPTYQPLHDHFWPLQSVPEGSNFSVGDPPGWTTGPWAAK